MRRNLPTQAAVLLRRNVPTRDEASSGAERISFSTSCNFPPSFVFNDQCIPNKPSSYTLRQNSIQMNQ